MSTQSYIEVVRKFLQYHENYHGTSPEIEAFNRSIANKRAIRNAALEEAAVILDTMCVNISGTTNGKSGALVFAKDALSGLGMDAVRATFADAIRALKSKQGEV